MRRFGSEPAKKSGQNIPKNRRVAAINAREGLVVFQGSAKMFTVEDAGGALQKGFAAPDITPTYCLPATA